MEASRPLKVSEVLDQLINEISIHKTLENTLWERIKKIFQEVNLSSDRFPNLLVELNELKEQMAFRNISNCELIRFFCTQFIKKQKASRSLLNPTKNNFCFKETEELRTRSPLPKVILESILQLLIKDSPTWDTVGMFAQTCKSFYFAAKNPRLIKEFLTYGSSEITGLSNRLAISKLKELIHFKDISFNLYNPSNLTEEDHDTLFSFPNFDSFEISEFESDKILITDKNIKKLARSSSHLRTLIIHEAGHLTSHSLFALASQCTNLQSLKILNCQKSNIKVSALNALIACCEKLTKIGISFAGDNTLRHRFIASSSDIEVVKKFACQPFDRWLDFINQNERKLCEFEIENISITDSSFSKVINLSQESLEKIALARCDHLSLDSLFRLAKCKNLRHFELLDSKTLLKNETLQSIAKEWSNLQIFSLYNCSKLSTQGVIKLIQQCPKLESLTLDLHRINATNFQALFSTLKTSPLKKMCFNSSCTLDFKNGSEIIDLLCSNRDRLPLLNTFHLKVEALSLSLEDLSRLAVSFPTLEFLWPLKKLPSIEELTQFNDKHPDFILICI